MLQAAIFLFMVLVSVWAVWPAITDHWIEPVYQLAELAQASGQQPIPVRIFPTKDWFKLPKTVHTKPFGPTQSPFTKVLTY